MPLPRRHQLTATLAVSLFAASTWAGPQNALAQKAAERTGNELCLGCHARAVQSSVGARPTILPVDREELAGSVHGGLSCTQCHINIQGPAHPPVLAEVNCRRCHSLMPGWRSAPTKKKAVEPGAHWQALTAGKAGGPTCKDCHGSHGVLPPENPRSSVHRESVPRTCGRCHPDGYSDYRESVHGAALAKGNTDVPVCTDCHGEHPVQGPSGSDSPVSPAQVPETCSSCHEPLGLAHRYGLPTGRYETYRRSYHGIANWFGNVAVAHCASCHGAHDIRPSSDPKSSVNKRNLPRTCGKCHPGAGAKTARGSIHVVVARREEPVLYFVSTGFRWLTILVMSGLVGHIMLDLIARWRERNRTKG